MKRKEKLVSITIQIPPHELETLRRIADAEGTSISEVTRSMIGMDLQRFAPEILAEVEALKQKADEAARALEAARKNMTRGREHTDRRDHTRDDLENSTVKKYIENQEGR
jgi:hypothetical protein